MEIRPTVFVVADDEELCDSVTRTVGSLATAIRCFSTTAEILEFCKPRCPAAWYWASTCPGLQGLRLPQMLTARGCHQPFIAISTRV